MPVAAPAAWDFLCLAVGIEIKGHPLGTQFTGLAVKTQHQRVAQRDCATVVEK